MSIGNGDTFCFYFAHRNEAELTNEYNYEKTTSPMGHTNCYISNQAGSRCNYGNIMDVILGKHMVLLYQLFR